MIVSFCITAYNEEEYLPSLFEDICMQTYPRDQIEVVLVDGNSEDRSKKLMEEFRDQEQGFFGIQVLDNPRRIQAAGWNVAFEHFQGDVLVRIDAHSKIPADFIARNAALLEAGEMITGGMRPVIIKDPSPWKEVLLEAENSMFGSGIAPCRRKRTKGYVKSMFHACYRREVLEKVGFMNEGLGRTEDNEFHYRLRKVGYRFCFCSDIRSYQYARPNLSAMLKQKYGNGYWIGVTSFVCPACLAIYHFVPFFFVCGIGLTSVLAFAGYPKLAELLWGTYGMICGGMGVAGLIREKKPLMVLLPFLFPALHISYGLGTCRGLLAVGVWKRLREQEKRGKAKGYGLYRERAERDT